MIQKFDVWIKSFPSSFQKPANIWPFVCHILAIGTCLFHESYKSRTGRIVVSRGYRNSTQSLIYGSKEHREEHRSNQFNFRFCCGNYIKTSGKQLQHADSNEPENWFKLMCGFLAGLPSVTAHRTDFVPWLNWWIDGLLHREAAFRIICFCCYCSINSASKR